METSGPSHKKALHSKTEQPLATTRVVVSFNLMLICTQQNPHKEKM